MKTNKLALIATLILTISIILTACGRKEVEEPTTVSTTEPATIEPYILLSDIRHEFYEKEVIGRIVSEDLGVDCNLVFGTTDECLSLGAGLHKTSSIPGYATPPIIGGHVLTDFKGFANAEKGKTITISMPYGDYVYEIAKTDVMNKNEFDFSIKEEPIMQAIFYTCYPFGKVNYEKTDRFFLYCDLVEGTRILDDIHYDVSAFTTAATPENKVTSRATTTANNKK